MEEYYKGTQSTGYADKVEPTSPFDRLSEAVSSLREMQKMAHAIAERLTGPRPPEPTSQAKLEAVGGGGLFDAIDRQASLIRDIRADIYTNLSRIENRL